MPSTNDKIDFVRPEVEARLDQYKMIDACLEGESAIKAGREAYLPYPGVDDGTEKSKARYAAYLNRARFYNVAWRTWAEIVGQAFQKDVKIEVDSELAVLLKSVDGSEVTLEQQIKRANGEVLAKGRVGLLVDFPSVDKPVSREDLQSGKVAPTIAIYTASAITNWRIGRFGSQARLTMLELFEVAEISGDFEIKYEDRWRVIELIGGKCTVTLYKRADDGTKRFDVIDGYPREVKNQAGVPLDFIPFKAIGSENNDLNVDRPPMYDICTLNVGHYVNSAEWEESAFMVGQPTPVVTGLTTDWYESVLGKKITLGSRSGIPLPVGGSATLLQADPNTMAAEGMRDKEARMIALGARLLQPKSGPLTATEAKINLAAEASVVGTVIGNVQSAYEQALTWCGLFVGATQPPKVLLNKDISLSFLSAEELRLMSDLRKNGDLARSEFRDILTKTGWATLTMEEFNAEKASEGPSYDEITLPSAPTGSEQHRTQQEDAPASSKV